MREPLYYVQRCKGKRTNELWPTVHIADNDIVLCTSKPLDESWYITGHIGFAGCNIVVTCPKCKRIMEVVE